MASPIPSCWTQPHSDTGRAGGPRGFHPAFAGQKQTSTKNEIQFASLLPGTDIFQSDIMQTSVDHDIDSVTSAINNNPDVDIETIDPNEIGVSTDA